MKDYLRLALVCVPVVSALMVADHMGYAMEGWILLLGIGIPLTFLLRRRNLGKSREPEP